MSKQIQSVDLNFSNLSKLDGGKIEKLLQFHLHQISQDCMNRSNDKTKRVVTIKIYVVPISDDSGDCESCKISIDATSTVPKYVTKEYEMKPFTKGFKFNQDFPTEYDQPSLFSNQK